MISTPRIQASAVGAGIRPGDRRFDRARSCPLFLRRLLFAHLADVLAVPSELKAPTSAFEVPGAAIGDAIGLRGVALAREFPDARGLDRSCWNCHA